MELNKRPEGSKGPDDDDDDDSGPTTTAVSLNHPTQANPSPTLRLACTTHPIRIPTPDAPVQRIQIVSYQTPLFHHLLHIVAPSPLTL